MAVLNLIRSFCLVATALITAATAQQPEATTLFQVATGVELENIAVRSNGFLLATGVGHPAVYQFNPSNDTTPTEVAVIPNVTSLFGIAEISSDVFAISAGNWTRSARLVPGTFSVWTIDLRASEPVVEKVLDLPNAGFVNGMTAVPARRRSSSATLLMTDTVLGSVYHLDPATLQLETLFANATANATTSTPAVPQAGINGIRFNVQEQTLYYTNTILTVFCKVKLAVTYKSSGLPSIAAEGPFSVIASRLPGDDFAVAPDGTAFIGANPVNTLYKVTPEGNVTEFLGGRNQTVVAGATSAAFGRTRLDFDAIYVSTNGIPPVVNATSEGGKVVKVSLREAAVGAGECVV